MKKLRSVEERKEFVNDLFITCPYCGYNNEKQRLRKYATCLNCGKVLDEKTYFLIQLKKQMDKFKRRSS